MADPVFIIPQINRIMDTGQAVGAALLNRVAVTAELTLSELEQRMLVELGVRGPITMTELVTSLGQDKSQVSRSLAHLLEADLVRREARRSPLVLSPAGKRFADAAFEGALQSNAMFMNGLAQADQEWLIGMVAKLTQRAAQMLAEQRRLAAHLPADGDAQQPDVGQPEPPVGGAAVAPGMIIPRMLTLRALLQRAAFLAARRHTGLAYFEAQVFALIWEHAPVSTRQLSALTGRSVIQLDRITAHLADQQMIHRDRPGARRSWILQRMDGASDLYHNLNEQNLRFEAELQQRIPAAQIKRLARLLGRAEANTTAFLKATVQA